MNNVVIIVFMLFASDFLIFKNVIVNFRSILTSMNLSEIESRVLSSEIDHIVV